MELLNLFKTKNELTIDDLSKIKNIISSVADDLYKYKYCVPESIIDQQKHKGEGKQDFEVKKTCVLISIYYIAVIKYNYKKIDMSKNLLNYLSKEFDMITEELMELLKNNDYIDYTYKFMSFELNNYLKTICKGRFKKDEISLKLAYHTLNNYMNQKSTEYNVKILMEGLDKFLEITK